MSSKISADHLRRAAVVYVRQSTMAQVIGNLESQRRQYTLETLIRGRARRVLDLEPHARAAGLVSRIAPLRHDAFEAEAAGVLEHGGAIRRLNVLDKLDAIAGSAGSPTALQPVRRRRTQHLRDQARSRSTSAHKT